ncbi:MAG: hypothetical protein KDC95_01910 [Planctomycetes bacterium]|nr:hypothetical protein [Planctomycetota bacterium]
MNIDFSTLFAAASVLSGIAAVGHAQQTRIVPPHVATMDANSAITEFLTLPSRTQQLVRGSEFCTTTATLTEVTFRVDARASNAWTATTLNGFEAWLGHAATSVGAVSRDFAKNQSGAMVRVFSGNLQLPAQVNGRWKPQPWNVAIKCSTPFVYTRASGDLLIETNFPWANNSFNMYMIDCHGGTGTGYPYGTGGKIGGNPVGLTPIDSQSHPGGFLGVLGGFPTPVIPVTTPVVVLFGFSDKFFGSIPLPLDLTPLGAPGNSLYVSPDIFVATTMTQAGNQLRLDVHLPVPNNPGLDGVSIYAQAAFFDSSINALGIGFSSAIGFRIGLQTTGSQFLWGNPSGSTGIIVDHYIAPALKLSGSFN